ncbi:MAG: hypothetical protein GXP42_19370 [Chloroflexi bacterium]|nr:hypothetical protein [Chloroflexota bacterium]
MTHPFTFLTPTQRARWFWPLLALTLALTVALQWVDRPLQTEAAPQGIVSFEMARTTERAAAIIESWNDNARIHAGFSLGLDYLYMPLYALTIGLAVVWAGEMLRKRHWRAAGLGPWLAWGLLLAALLDAVENVALWRLLVGPVSEPWPGLAYWCANIKFALVGFGLGFALLGLFVRVRSGKG